MANNKAMFVGVDGIITAVNSYYPDAPYYSIWLGRNMVFQYNREDIEAGRKLLFDMLEDWADAGNTDLFSIRFYQNLDSKGYVTSKSPDVGTMTVRAVDYENMPMVSGTRVSSGTTSSSKHLPYPVYVAMQEIGKMTETFKSGFESMNQRIAAIEAMEIEDAEPVEPKTWVQHIGEILQIPAVQQLIPQILSSPVIAGLLGNVSVPQTTAQVSGINEQTVMPEVKMPPATVEPQSESEALEIINNSLERLSHHCDLVTDLKALADIAETKPDVFKLLLAQLRIM